MAEASDRTPWHLWAVGIVAVLFNAIGVFDYVMTVAQGPAYMASAGMTPPQIAYYQAMPGWVTVLWAVGVFTAFAASILLLARRKLAFPLFGMSLATFLLEQVHTYALSDGGAVMGREMAIAAVVIAVLLALFAWYARAMTARGVLR